MKHFLHEKVGRTMHVKSNCLKPPQLCSGGYIKAVLSRLAGGLTVFRIIGAITFGFI